MEQIIMSKKTASKKTAAPKSKIKKPKAVKAAAPAKVERDQQNGVTRPGAATICGSVWSFLDANKDATAKDVIAGIKDINEATARTQTQRFKKFHGAK
jgi:hypothetical protein